MSRTDSVLCLCALRVSIAATWCAAGVAQAGVPPIGSQTSDGFKVSAWWHFHYESKGVSDRRAIIGPLRPLDAPLNDERDVSGDADVTEEVNKSTGQTRAVIRDGSWSVKISGLHYTSHDGERVDCGPDALGKGQFQTAVVGYGVDDKTKKPMVTFGISADEAGGPPKMEMTYHPLETKIFDVFVSDKWKTGKIDAGVSGSCRVPFKTGYLSYRKRTPENGSPDRFEEIFIERTPRNVEAEIKASGKYKEWVPVLDTAVGFEAHIVDPPGLAAQEWHISLQNVSKLPGVCNNANMDDFPSIAAQWQNSIKKDSPDLIFDFRKYGKSDRSFQTVGKPYKNLFTTKPMNSVGFAVSCLDWGAYGRLAAEALVDGHWVHAVDRETKNEFIRIPWAPNDKLEASHMAMHAKTWRGEEKYYARDPNADDDDTPAGKKECRGDGLSVFDEYRGFYVRRGGVDAPSEFIRLDPDRKDLFVFMFRASAQRLWRHVPDFEKASGLDVHRVGDDHLRHFVELDTHVINFNSEGPKQCGLYMAISALEDGTAGQSQGAPPRNCEAVEFSGKLKSDATNFFKSTVIHELGHAVGIPHHGEDGYFTVDKNRARVPTSFVGIIVAKEGGEYSGDEDCALKYTGASYYVHCQMGPVTLSSLLKGPVLFPYDPKHVEINGLNFCTDPRGTRLNDKKRPDWQCGDADRGNPHCAGATDSAGCQSYILVNDRCPNPPATGGERLGPSQKRADLRPNDEAEHAASESQQKTNISLELNGARGRRSTAVFGGTAIFELIFSAFDAKTTPELGSDQQPWTQQIEFLTIDENKKLIPLAIPFRQAGKVTQLTLNTDTSEPRQENSAQIKLSTSDQISVNFAIDPAASSKLRSGTVRIFAALHPAGKNPSSQRTLSNSILLEIEDPAALPVEERTRTEARRLLSLAELAFTDQQYAEAENLARKVISITPDSSEAHLLLARSLEARQRLREAYDEYRESFALHRPQPGAIDEPPQLTAAAIRNLEQKLGLKREQVPLTLDMVFQHHLYAESGNAKAPPPFPQSASKLVFSWKSALPIANDLLGVRWIAEDVPGAEKNHVIATSKSEPDKREGEFGLTKPIAGFPPGQYRVEIWQAGKMIYSEKFEIKSE
jgi:hypothetical protein